MKRKSFRISLRYKLLVLLTILPLVTLALYLLMATQEFERDKMAYVYDSSVAVSRALSTQIRAEVESLLSRVRPIVEGYDEGEGKFSTVAEDLFRREGTFQGVVVFKGFPDGHYEKMGNLKREENSSATTLDDENRINALRDRARTSGLAIESLSPSSFELLVASRSGELEADKHVIFVLIYTSERLVQAFRKNVLYSSFLLDSEGRNLLGAIDLKATPLDGENFSEFFGPVLKSTRPEGTEEIANSRQQKTIVAYHMTGVGETRVASVVDRKAALKAVEILIAKSILFFVALLSITVIISVFASARLTSALRDLYEATAKIAGGDFAVRVETRSNDEVGGLAQGFNFMAEEVSRLMKETAEKARLQSELNTVKTVQETLFPATSFESGAYKVVGHFEPASECGGDWWSYSKVGNKLLIWIGDATGHGAPAALITSAARSAASIIEILPEMTPSEALKIMNRAIHETSKGRIMMTFFLAIIDLEKNVLQYANASHDPPYLVHKNSERALSKKDLIPLIEGVGPRLGEKIDSTYVTTQVDLALGDILFCYTDGVLDVKNMAGDALGERNFLKALVKSIQMDGEAQIKLDGLKSEIEGFRQGAGLIDDVTMVMCQYKGAA